jgi:septum formation inhibitor MinC
MRFRFGRRGDGRSPGIAAAGRVGDVSGRVAASQASAPQLRQMSLLSVQSEPQLPFEAQM